MAQDVKIGVKIDSSQAVTGANKLSEAIKVASREISTASKSSKDLGKTSNATTKELDKSSKSLKSKKDNLNKLSKEANRTASELKKVQQESSKETSSKAGLKLAESLKSASNISQELNKSIKTQKQSFESLLESVKKINPENKAGVKSLEEQVKQLKNIIATNTQIIKQENTLNTLKQRSELHHARIAKYTAQIEINAAKQQAIREKARLDLERKRFQFEQYKARGQETKSASPAPALPSVGGLGTVLAGGALATSIAEAASSYQRLANSLKLVVSSGENVKDVLTDLFEAANETRQPIDAVTQAYQTLRKNTSQLHLSQKQLLALTTTLSKAIAIGGSDAQQASNSMIQFGQALTMGKLSGQNLNSVMEQTPGIIETIATGLGMTSAELRVYANEGQLTTEKIVKSLEKAADTTDQKFNSMSLTVSGALTQLKTNFTRFVGENDFLSEKLAKGISFIGNNFELISKGIVLITTAAIGFKAIRFYEYLVTIGKESKITTIRLTTLGNAFSMNGVKAIRSRGANLLYAGSLKALNGSIGLVTIGWRAFDMAVKTTVIGAVLSGIVWVIQKVIDKYNELFAVTDYASNAMQEVTKDIERLQEENKDLEAGLYDLIEANKVETASIQENIDALKKRKEEIEATRDARKYAFTFNQYSEEAKELEALSNKIKELNDSLQRSTARGEALEKEQRRVKTESANLSRGFEDLKISTDNVGESQSNFEKQLSSVKEALSLVESRIERLQMGYSGAGNELDQFNDKVKAGVHEYQGLTAQQIETLRTQIALLVEKKQIEAGLENFNKIKEKQDAELRMLDYRRSIVGQEEDVQARLIAQQERRIQLESSLTGVTVEQRDQILANYDEIIEKENELDAIREEKRENNRKRIEEDSNSFLAMLDRSRTKLSDVKQFGVKAVNDLGRGIADAALGGKVNFEEMARAAIRGFIRIAIEAAVTGAVVMAIDYATGGGFSSTMKAVDKATGATSSAGGGNSVAGFFSKLFFGVGFASGGYTGDAPRDQVVGVVHGQEGVVNADGMRRLGIANLNRLNAGEDILAVPKGVSNFAVHVNIINNTNARVDVTRNRFNELEIFVTDIAGNVFDEKIEEYHRN